MSKLPLEGVRVLDLCIVWAGPFGTQILADLGAEVIKVENVHHWQTMARGFMARPPKAWLDSQVPMIGAYPDKEPGERPWNRCPTFNNVLRNKKSMTVDIRNAQGMDILKRLIQASDVVYENNVTETMDKLGITYDFLKEINPEIIFIRVPAYGNEGPYRNFRALGVHLESVIGHSLLRGYTDSDPSTNSGVFMGDYAAGAMGAFAVMAALYHRKRTGKGQLIELAQAETAIGFLADAVTDYTLNGRVQSTLGNRDMFGSAPCGAFRASGDNRWIAVTVTNDTEWNGLCDAMGNPDWCKEDRFGDQFSRWQNIDELEGLLNEWTSQHDTYDLFHLLQKHGVPSGPIMHAADAYSDPHVEERDFFKELTHADAGTHRYPGLMFKMSRSPVEVKTPPARLGEHNEYVYKEVLKFSDEEYAQLESDGHIGTDFDPDIP